jgi:hypothetical protein
MTVNFTVAYNNSPPILEPLENIFVNETQQVIIEVIATDPDNDTLEYFINDSRFTQNNNIFTWQTTYNDAGQYDVLITVSDGYYNVSQVVGITVNDTPLVYIFDDSGNHFVILSGTWNSRNIQNAINQETRYNNPGIGMERAGWRTNNVMPGTYSVSAWKFQSPFLSRMGTNVHYMVYSRLGTSNWLIINQQQPGNEWMPLGMYEFDNTHAQGILITDEANGIAASDAVRLIYEGPLTEADSVDVDFGFLKEKPKDKKQIIKEKTAEMTYTQSD